MHFSVMDYYTVLDNEEAKPSSPLPFSFYENYASITPKPMILISKKDRPKVLDIIRNPNNHYIIVEINKKHYKKVHTKRVSTPHTIAS